MSNYPTKIDNNITLPKIIDGSSVVKGEILNKYQDAIIKIEDELGLKPSSVYGTVRSRLDAIEAGLGPYPLRLFSINIIANQNNWYDPEFDNADVIKIGNLANFNITGINKLAFENQLPKILINVGSGTITLKHDITSSSDNRFYNPDGYDINLFHNEGVYVFYDTEDHKIRLIMKFGGEDTNANLTTILANNNSADGYRITNLGNPIGSQDAATKSYVDGYAQQLKDYINSAIPTIPITVDGYITTDGYAQTVIIRPLLSNSLYNYGVRTTAVSSDGYFINQDLVYSYYRLSSNSPVESGSEIVASTNVVPIGTGTVVAVSGNNLLFQVQGDTGKTIKWNIKVWETVSNIPSF